MATKSPKTTKITKRNSTDSLSNMDFSTHSTLTKESSNEIMNPLIGLIAILQNDTTKQRNIDHVIFKFLKFIDLWLHLEKKKKEKMTTDDQKACVSSFVKTILMKDHPLISKEPLFLCRDSSVIEKDPNFKILCNNILSISAGHLNIEDEE